MRRDFAPVNARFLHDGLCHVPFIRPPASNWGQRQNKGFMMQVKDEKRQRPLQYVVEAMAALMVLVLAALVSPANASPLDQAMDKVYTVRSADAEGAASYRKYRNYVDLLFSARIVADADLNWKNFLGLYYQPFKVFMIMENKERTSATETRYVQYVPKDVPFYWTDNTLNIPILKTPGGKYVDVLRGSSDDRNPEYDMDSDGHPGDEWHAVLRPGEPDRKSVV